MELHRRWMYRSFSEGCRSFWLLPLEKRAKGNLYRSQADTQGSIHFLDFCYLDQFVPMSQNIELSLNVAHLQTTGTELGLRSMSLQKNWMKTKMMQCVCVCEFVKKRASRQHKEASDMWWRLDQIEAECRTRSRRRALPPEEHKNKITQKRKTVFVKGT